MSNLGEDAGDGGEDQELQNQEGQEQVEGEEPEPETGEPSAEEEGEPSAKEPQITLDQLSKLQPFKELQSRVDRVSNVMKSFETENKQLRELVKTLRAKEDEEIIAQLGDSPQTRDVISQLRNFQDKESETNARYDRVQHLEKLEVCNSLMQKLSIPEIYREQLMGAESPEELGVMAKTLGQLVKDKKILINATKPGGKNVPPSKPALTHIPDKAHGSAAPTSVEQFQQDYIEGKISWQVYQAKMNKAGREA